MKNPITEVYFGLKSLFVGMRITIGEFFKPTVTVHYPHETLKMPARFRGHIELVRDEKTGIAKCFVCKLCEKACPSDCITVEGIKPEGARRKTVNYYRLDFTKCSLCGSCVEACRDGAIRFSREYNLAGLHKEDFVMDLFKRLEAENVRNPVAQPPAAEITTGTPAPAAEAPKAPAAVAETPKAPAVAPASAAPQPATVEVK